MHYIEWNLIRMVDATEVSIPICCDYHFESDGSVLFDFIYLKDDENNPDADEFELTSTEREGIEDHIVEHIGRYI